MSAPPPRTRPREGTNRRAGGPALLIVLLLCCLPLFPAGGPALSEEPRARGPVPPGLPDAKADAEAYAGRFGVPKGEASRRLALQRDAGTLDERLAEEMPGAYAGLYLRHDPAFAVVVRLAGSGPGREKDAAEDIAAAHGLTEEIEIVGAAASLEELRAQQREAARAAAAGGAPADTAVDVRENRVRVAAPDPPPNGPLARQARLPSSRLSLADDFGGILPAAASYGGEPVVDAALRRFCTKGFSVRARNGAAGATTAAHCPNRLHGKGGRLPYRAGRLYGPADVQWHATPNSYDAPRVRFAGGHRAVMGSVPRSGQPVGGWVCKHGARTGTTCGTISGKWYAPGYVPNAAATFIGVRSSRPVVLPGDSGGPFMASNRAYGTATAYSRSGSAYYGYYMPVDYLARLGLRLAVAR